MNQNISEVSFSFFQMQTFKSYTQNTMHSKSKSLSTKIVTNVFGVFLNDRKAESS